MGRWTFPNQSTTPPPPVGDRLSLYSEGDVLKTINEDGDIFNVAADFFSGSGAPAGSLGRIGDLYFDDVSNQLYQKTAVSTWTLIGNMGGTTDHGALSNLNIPSHHSWAVNTDGTNFSDTTHGSRGGGSLHNAATTSVSGFLSASDKTKLDGVETGATAESGSLVSPPDIAASGAAGADTNVYANANHTHGHGNQAGGSLHSGATTSVAGFMSAADKTKLDGISSGVFPIDPSVRVFIYDDFITGNEDSDEVGSLGWRVSSAGTGNVTARFQAIAGHPGILRLAGGTVAAARAIIHLGESGLNTVFLGSGEIICEALIRLTGTISQHERTNVGLAVPNLANGENTDGVYFAIRNGDTNWQFICRAGGVQTVVNTGIAFVSGQWERFRFVVNAGATSVEGFRNGVSIGTTTTNIPSAAALSPFLKTDALSAGGGVATPVDIDYYCLGQVFTTPR